MISEDSRTSGTGVGLNARGALLFGRYAFPPNQLGYCGPEDNQALLEYVSTRTVDKGLLELERRFEGAYPYLCLIAQANHIADPFDERVVEAYWVGNGLLERVDAATFYDSLNRRFRPRMKAADFRWLASKLELSARPHHNFHVFDIYTRGGLMRDERASIALKPMDSCRISWGRVVEVGASQLQVERQPIVLEAGKLALGKTEIRSVKRQQNGLGFVDQVQAGAIVSIHWDWACEGLDERRYGRLRAATLKYLEIANQTI
ncbi:MAG: DUF6390 family protein [Candidatus Dormibacteraeota bacterium]|nr:DUF6390 family protein [Candidatus Dormibacteraeota bacterium]